jgi:hypothetical protein
MSHKHTLSHTQCANHVILHNTNTVQLTRSPLAASQLPTAREGLATPSGTSGAAHARGRHFSDISHCFLLSQSQIVDRSGESQRAHTGRYYIVMHVTVCVAMVVAEECRHWVCDAAGWRTSSSVGSHQHYISTSTAVVRVARHALEHHVNQHHGCQYSEDHAQSHVFAVVSWW